MPVAQKEIEIRNQLIEGFSDARVRTDDIFGIVRPDSLYERPIPERHRIVFYIGHLEAFDWNLLRERLLDIPTFDTKLDPLFAFGIDPVDGGLPTDRPSDWPRLKDVREYVAQIRSRLDDALEVEIERLGSDDSREFAASQLLHVAVEHRLMHAETLAYMLHQLPLSQKI